MSADSPPGHLHRSFGLLQATAMNMSNMVGVGPFLTIPLILAAMGGPQAMLGWIVGARAGHLRRHGLGRIGLRRAVLRRHVRVPEGRLSPERGWDDCCRSCSSGSSSSRARWKSPPATSASPSTRPTSCRMTPPYMTWLAVGVGVLTVVAALPQDRVGGQAHGGAVGGNDADHRRRACSPACGISTPTSRSTFPPDAFNFSTRVRARAGLGDAGGDVRFPRLLQRLLHRRRGAELRRAPFPARS